MILCVYCFVEWNAQCCHQCFVTFNEVWSGNKYKQWNYHTLTPFYSIIKMCVINTSKLRNSLTLFSLQTTQNLYNPSCQSLVDLNFGALEKLLGQILFLKYVWWIIICQLIIQPISSTNTPKYNVVYAFLSVIARFMFWSIEEVFTGPIDLYEVSVLLLVNQQLDWLLVDKIIISNRNFTLFISWQQQTLESLLLLNEHTHTLTHLGSYTQYTTI